jgi:hypothetical protein
MKNVAKVVNRVGFAENAAQLKQIKLLAIS